jgi:hypothetical protein
MLKISSLQGIPDENANRMMMAHGSRQLLRAIRGEPEPLPLPRINPKKVRQSYVPVSDRPPLAVPRVVRDIIEAVAEAFEVHPDEMRGEGKAQTLVLARAVAIRLIRARTWESGEPKHSLPTIGRYLRRDHSSISHSLKNFDVYARHFPEIAEIYDRLNEGAE